MEKKQFSNAVDGVSGAVVMCFVHVVLLRSGENSLQCYRQIEKIFGQL